MNTVQASFRRCSNSFIDSSSSSPPSLLLLVFAEMLQAMRNLLHVVRGQFEVLLGCLLRVHGGEPRIVDDLRAVLEEATSAETAVGVHE